MGETPGACQQQTGGPTEAALQNPLSLIIRPLDSLVLLGVCVCGTPPPQDDAWAPPSLSPAHLGSPGVLRDFQRVGDST